MEDRVRLVKMPFSGSDNSGCQKRDDIYNGLLMEAGEVIKSASAPASAYLAADIVTATPQRLEVLLFDSVIRMCRRALGDIDAGEFGQAAELLNRCCEIVGHFRRTSEIAGDGELAELLGEISRRLMEAGFYRRREDIKAAIASLDTRRDDISTHLRAVSKSRSQDKLQSQPGRPGRCWIG